MACSTAAWIIHLQAEAGLFQLICHMLGPTLDPYALQVQEKLDKFQQRRLHEFFVPGGGSSKGDKVADLEVRLRHAVKSMFAAA